MNIDDVVVPTQSWNPASDAPDEIISYIDLSAIDKESKKITATSSIMGKGAPSRARQIVAGGDILVSTVRPNLNGVAIVPDELDGATASTGYCVLRANTKKADRRFLFWLVTSAPFIKDMVKKATGASYPAVSNSTVKEYPFPKLSLVEQRRIADILDQADALRRKQQDADRLAGDFSMSYFLSLFGDPVVNPNSYNEVRLDQVADIRSGVTLGRKTTSLCDISAPYLRVANVQDGYLNLDEVKFITVTSAELERFRLQRGDLLLTEGGDPDKLGRGHIWNDEIADCIHQNHIFSVRVKAANILPEFLSIQIGSLRGKRYFLKVGKQTTGIATINKNVLSAFPVLAPPPALQRRFAEGLNRHSVVAEKVAASTLQASELLTSLSQRFFG